MSFDCHNLHMEIIKLEEKNKQLEQQNKELKALLCQRCDYFGACELDEIPCAVKNYKPKICAWVSVDEEYYDTSCDNAFVFIDGGPVDNKFKFCPYCGEPIKVLKQEERDE